MTDNRDRDRDRDEALGQALRGLDVPDHRPGFQAGLLARLEEEATRHPGSIRRPRWTGPYMLTAAVAAVAVIVLATTAVLTGNDRGDPGTGPQLIRASEVRARVAGALASYQTLRGRLTVECEVPTGECSPPDGGGRTTLQWSFVTTAAGDERITGIGAADDLAYNTAERTYRELTTFGSGVQGYEASNLPAGPPDYLGQHSPLRREVSAVVRAFVADTSEIPVTDAVEQGRDAWRLVVPVVPNKLAGPGGSGDQLEILIDRTSGFPRRVTETLGGRFLREIRLSDLVADEPVDPSLFTFAFPPELDVFHQDVGFQRVTLDQAAAIIGYRPVLPTDVPAGFRITEITAAAQGRGTGMEGMNPAAPGVVSVAYRRGFDRIVVSTRLRNAPRCADLAPPIQEDCWADPLSSGEGFIDEPVPFVIGAGALAGARAELVVSPNGLPHVWSIDDRLVVTVAGDASADELRRLAESFTPR